MKQIQFYKYATLVLIVLNVSVIAFFVFTKPKPPHRGDDHAFSKRATEILKLDEQQQRNFLQSAKQHHQQMQTIHEQQRDLLKPYFHTLIDSTTSLQVDSTLTKIQQLERTKIESTYQHFQEVKSMLRQEQKPGFEKFMNRALGVILVEDNKNMRPPKGF